jgi:perosamine synthetase
VNEGVGVINKIAWWRTSFANGEAELIAKNVALSRVSQGPVVELFEERLADFLGVPHVVATSSGSAALMMSLIAAGIRPGDEVIVPDRSWIATANAPFILGAKVKLVDVEDHRPIIDARSIESAISERTKAIMPVHLGGRSADMHKINEIAKHNQLTVIEDAAQALGSRNDFGFLGTQGDFGCFSLSVAKIISTGQGGFITTKSPEHNRALRMIRTQGVEDIVNSRWKMPGFNFRMTDVLASIGIVQLSLLQERMDHVKKIYAHYREGIEDINQIKIVDVNTPAGEVPVYSEALVNDRDELVRYLASRDIEVRPFYPGINSADYMGDQGAFPNSEQFGSRGIYLPSGPNQSLENVDRTLSEIHSFFG